MMLKYMHDHCLDKFEWFMRADDDVFIRGDKLELFLRSINSSKPHFIGQAGLGNKEEFGLLSLEYDENFCMGKRLSKMMMRMRDFFPTGRIARNTVLLVIQGGPE